MEDLFQHPIFEDLILIPKNCKISSLSSYKSGKIYGIEVRSAVVIKSLDPQPGEHILDICCSPGAKLSYIADQVSYSIANSNYLGHQGLILGNDINIDRLNTCNSVLSKYNLDSKVHLVCHDGVTLSIDDIKD